MQTPQSAATQVFAVTELLEQILLYLLNDLKPSTNREDVRSPKVQTNARLVLHLLRCTEVNSTWHRCILYGSAPIQRALFLLPEPEGARSWQQQHLIYPNQRAYYRGAALEAPILNPVIQTAITGLHFRYWRSGLGAEGPRHHAYLIVTRRHLSSVGSLIGKDYGGNVRKMLLSQPPPTGISTTVWERDDHVKDFGERTTIIRDPFNGCVGPFTLGLVLENVGRIFDQYEDVISVKLTTV